MATTANARLTASALLGTVTTAAATVTSTLDAAQKGIGMLNTAINDAAYRQEKRSKVDRKNYVKNLIRETSEQEAMANVRVEEFLKNNPAAASHYKASYDELTELLAD
ncbi:hypothetical protein HYP93_gp01 [Stenotrophomonas phage Pokken]|uniref:Uncharacterized protein n=1 Tax=Stenotrophomonas phage Pokken TaxID=2596674 RepID=A0A5B9N5J7_9CAUD|nr:hypothetical protein HYP93_gp01 [Stenotrophomonas phage Pokken]QEG09224.1 hypothetical protein CPT_Pokken_001 [Stenotrophomonas phage Pokken]